MENDITVSVQQLAALSQKPEILDIGGIHHALVPKGFEFKPLPELLSEPLRIERRVAAHDVRGLIDYTNKFKDSRSALFCGPQTAPSITARLDDHQPSAPSKITHQVTFNCPRTEEWTRWTTKDKAEMDQVEFARFIEANLRDITEPSGSEVLTATLNFVDKGTADFKSATRLSDGRVQFHFVEKDDNTEVRFPEKLKIAVPVFEGQDFRVPVEAKLRYRVAKEDGLTLWYELDRPDLALRAAYEALLESVKAAVELPLYRAL